GPNGSLIETITRQLEELAADIEAEDPAATQQATALRTEAARQRTALTAIADGTYTGAEFDQVPVAHWRNWMLWMDQIREHFVAAHAPLLVLNGDLDFNVRLWNFERFRAAADEAGLRNVTFEMMPRHTHSFVALPAERGVRLEPTISPA